jgi:hypothetical protein
VGLRYRRLGTICRINLKGREMQKTEDFLDFFTFENRMDILSRNVGRILPLHAT